MLPLTPPVVELLGCAEFDWSVEVCGVVVLMFEFDEFGEDEVPVVELD